MKLKYILIYFIIIVGGAGLGIAGLLQIFNSVSWKATLNGLTMTTWGLAMATHALWYWHFSRQYVATATEPRPTLELFNTWLNPIQQRLLNSLRYSFTGLALVWLISTLFF